MNRIDDLLKADINNAAQTKKLFYEFDPLLLEAFDDATNLFEILFRSFSTVATDDKDQAEILQLAEEFKVSQDYLVRIVKKENVGLTDDRLKLRLEEINNRFFSRRTRGILLLNAYRAFMYAAADIRRLRLLSALGQLRFEIESIALISIFQNHKEFAEEWFHLKSDEEGRAFFSKTKRMVMEFCKNNDLLNEWNLASSGSQHARFAGMVEGLKIENFSKEGRYINKFSFSLQDFDPDHPERLIVRALYILRAQAKIFPAFKLSLPEVSAFFLEVANMTLFYFKIEKLYANFERSFPGYIRQIENKISKNSTGD
jgi:hypothetical protein